MTSEPTMTAVKPTMTTQPVNEKSTQGEGLGLPVGILVMVLIAGVFILIVMRMTRVMKG
jgi:hypothetical protein